MDSLIKREGLNFVQLPDTVIVIICRILIQQSGTADLFSLRITCKQLFEFVSNYPFSVSLEFDFSSLKILKTVCRFTDWKIVNLKLDLSSSHFSNSPSMRSELSSLVQESSSSFRDLKYFSIENCWHGLPTDLSLAVDQLAKSITHDFTYIAVRMVQHVNSLTEFVRSRAGALLFSSPGRNLDLDSFPALDDFFLISSCEQEHRISGKNFGLLKKIRIDNLMPMWNATDYVGCNSCLFQNVTTVEIEIVVFNQSTFFNLIRNIPNCLYLNIILINARENMKDIGPYLDAVETIKFPEKVRSLEINVLRFLYKLEPASIQELSINHLPECEIDLITMAVKRFSLRILNICRSAKSQSEMLICSREILRNLPTLEVLSMRDLRSFAIPHREGSSCARSERNSCPRSEICYFPLVLEFSTWSLPDQEVITKHQSLKAFVLYDLPVVLSANLNHELMRRINCLDCEFKWRIRRHVGSYELIDFDRVVNIFKDNEIANVGQAQQ